MLFRWFITACLLSVCFTSNVFAHTSVWKVTKNNASVYLGGTIHVLSEDDYPLPLAFQQAYRQSSIVYFEVDLNALASASFFSMLGRESLYPLGENLQGKLTPDTWARLDAYLAGRGLSADSINHLRPGAVMSTLLSLELTKLGVSTEGVDHYFHDRSTVDDKEIRAFETAEQQIQLIANLGAGQEEEFIAYLIDDLDVLTDTFDKMRDAWLHGEHKLLAKISRLDEMETEDPRSYNALLKNRNAAWMPVIEEMFNTSAIELVLVGALHMAGDDGLLSMLADKGYQITQLQEH